MKIMLMLIKKVLLCVAAIIFLSPLIYSINNTNESDFFSSHATIKIKEAPSGSKGYSYQSKYLVAKMPSSSYRFICKPNLFREYRSCFHTNALDKMNNQYAKIIWYKKSLMFFYTMDQIYSVELKNGVKYVVTEDLQQTAFVELFLYYLFILLLVIMVFSSTNSLLKRKRDKFS